MNSRTQDYVTPAEPHELVVNTILPDFDIQQFEDGFCDKTMTLKFRVNKHYKPHMLPSNTTPDSATTHVMLSTSLAFVEHSHTMFYIKDEELANLYHVIDNPAVHYDMVLGEYRATQQHYIDRETMTGIIIRSASKVENHFAVAGIFAPRGYGKIELYNQFTNKYLTAAESVE